MNAPTVRIMALGLGALLVLTAACGEEDVGLYSRDQAVKVVQELLLAWKAGDKAGILSRCGAPFLFDKREWKSAKALEVNLTAQMERLWEEASGFTEVRAWSWADLMDGRWPRNRPVKEAERDKELSRLGVKPDGFLVHATRAARRGWVLVVNPGAEGLVIQGILP